LVFHNYIGRHLGAMNLCNCLKMANPLGIKGVGKIGIVGVAAAIANAVYHTTGKRVRDLPITLDKLQR
jgi:CO/xanthine dehydrogenase Mo-binding subunit